MPYVKVGQENFAWRDRDQATQVLATPAIDPEEIARIRIAMHGIPLPQDDGRDSSPSKRVVKYTIKSP